MAAILPIESLITKCEMQPQTDLVVKFVDFSSKYGLGYKLSNGAFGVLFNDSTKIITSANLFHFAYIERAKEDNAEMIQEYDFFNYPSSINKKVVLLQHFKSYLEGNSKFRPMTFPFTKETAPERPDDMDNLAYIKKWKRARKAILLRNTNKVIQVIFSDQSELILASGAGMVTFVNSKHEIKNCPLQSSDNQQL
jgi:polo-like kinase 1